MRNKPEIAQPQLVRPDEGGPELRRRVKSKALQWLAQREHSRLELARKLAHWHARSDSDDRDPGADLTETVDSVLGELAHAGLLSDERFAQSRLHLRQARFGNRRIAFELKQHGVLPSDEQWLELRSSEIERAIGIIRQRFKLCPNTPLANDQVPRAQRFLAGRGFSAEAIRTALRHSASSSDADGAD